MLGYVLILTLIACGYLEASTVSTPDELVSALERVRPGDTVTMAARDWPDLILEVKGGGREGKPVTIRAEARGKTRLVGSSAIVIDASHVVVDGLVLTEGKPTTTAIAFREGTSHSRVTNCSIVDYKAGPEDEHPPMWVSVKGSHHRVDHCAFTGRKDVTGLMRVAVEDAPRYHRIDHNYFGQFAYIGKNGAETIRIIDTHKKSRSSYVRRSSKTTVAFNLFESCDGEAAEIISNKGSDNVYRGNTFRRSMGALTLRQGRGCLVEGNFFFGEGKSGTMGIRVLGKDHIVRNDYMEGLVAQAYEGSHQALDREPEMRLHLDASEKTQPGDSVDVVKDWHPSHWGTELLEAEDADGRVVTVQVK